MKYSTFVLTILLTVSTAVIAQQPINEIRDVSPGGNVNVENISGTVSISEWDSNQVEVTGTLGKGSKRLDFNVKNGRTTIEVVLDHNVRNSRGSDLFIRIPAGTHLSAETVSADITGEQLTGRLELDSVSGRIDITGQPSDLEIETVSGNIKIEFAPTHSEISSVSGDIDVADAAGRVEVACVSGNIDLTASSLDGIDVETVSGEAKVTTDLIGTGRFQLESVSGTVILSIPRGAPGDFDLSTFSGKIRNQIGPQAEKTSRYTPGESAKFSTGSGGPRVNMSSFSGTVKLIVH